MFLSKLFKRTKNKVMVAIAGLTMVLGTGAAISTVTAAQQNEVVETKATSYTYDGSTLVYLYLDSTNWGADGAKIWLYVFNGGNNDAALMVSNNGTNHFKTFVPAGTWTNFIFVRCYGNYDDFDWSHKISDNQTQNLDALDLSQTNCYKLTGWTSATSNGYYDAPDENGWWLVGDAEFMDSIGTSGVAWKYQSGFQMTPDDPDNQAKALGINLQDGAQFKGVWWYEDSGGECRSASVDSSSGATGFSVSGNSIIISSTRNYDVYYQTGGNLYITNSKRTVTFDANGHGTAPSALENVIDGNIISAPTAPTATGYTFGGWYKEEGCSNAWTFASDVVSADITLYAKWTINSYAVTIAGDDGISSVYLSTSSSATSGSASGTTFNYGVTVYGFVVLSTGYAHQNTWTKVGNGDDDVSGAKYLIGSLTVATSGNDFGTITPISGEDFAIEWATDFNEAIRGEDGGVCKSDGSTTISSLVTAWGGQSTAYAALAGYKQYWLAEATKSEDSAVTTALAQYDYVCGKYGPNGQEIDGITDFMGRDPKPKSAAVIPGAPSANQSPLTLTLWIVLGAGILGLGAIGTAYFVSKKKKRHQA